MKYPEIEKLIEAAKAAGDAWARVLEGRSRGKDLQKPRPLCAKAGGEMTAAGYTPGVGDAKA